jgi:hypothetical protein
MKYVKFKMVDSVTGISVYKQDSANGPVLPNLGDIYNLFTSFDMYWYYGEVNDDAPFDPENFIFELTFEEYKNEIAYLISSLQSAGIDNAYEQEKKLRLDIFGKYHESATIAGIQKYQEAVDFLDGKEASSTLQIESAARGVDILTLSQKIVNNHDKFRETDAKLSGLRGMIVDRIKSFSFDPENPYQSLLRYNDTESVPNIRLLNSAGPTINEGPAANLIGKHVVDLERRWEYLLFLEKKNSSEE